VPPSWQGHRKKGYHSSSHPCYFSALPLAPLYTPPASDIMPRVINGSSLFHQFCSCGGPGGQHQEQCTSYNTSTAGTPQIVLARSAPLDTGGFNDPSSRPSSPRYDHLDIKYKQQDLEDSSLTLPRLSVRSTISPLPMRRDTCSRPNSNNRHAYPPLSSVPMPSTIAMGVVEDGNNFHKHEWDIAMTFLPHPTKTSNDSDALKSVVADENQCKLSPCGNGPVTRDNGESSDRECKKDILSIDSATLTQSSTPMIEVEASLAIDEDKEYATEFSFAVLSSMVSCTFTPAVDMKSMRMGLPEGFPGMGCYWCHQAAKSLDEELDIGVVGFPKKGHGRFFPSSIKTMSDSNKTLFALYRHISRCNYCPGDVKTKIMRLKEGHAKERKDKFYGSQKQFFTRIWNRLHRSSPLLISNAATKRKRGLSTSKSEPTESVKR